MHKSFFLLFIVTLIIVAATAFAKTDQLHLAGIVFSLIPLISYHFSLNRKKTLTSNEVDSVYYFGFLVTVSTLVATAIAIALNKESKPNLSGIMLQFALGLVATGYALLARLHLLSKLQDNSEHTFIESSENIAKRVNDIASELSRAQNQITAFIGLSEDSFTEARAKFESSISDAELSFKENLIKSENAFTVNVKNSYSTLLTGTSAAINGSALQFSEAISLVMKEIERIQNEAKTISFTLAGEKLALFADEMSNSLRAIKDTAVQSGQESLEALSEMNKAATKLQQFAVEIVSRTESLQSLHDVLSVTKDFISSLDGMAQSALSTGSAFGSLQTIIGEAGNDIHQNIIVPVKSSALQGTLDQTVTSLREMNVVTENIVNSFAVVSGPVHEGVNNVSNGLKSFNKVLQSLSDSLIATNFEPEMKSAKEQIHRFEIQTSELSDALLMHREQLNKILTLAITGMSIISSAASDIAVKEHEHRKSEPAVPNLQE